MARMIGFPEKTDSIAAGAWMASKTRKLADGRFEGCAALFAYDPSQGAFPARGMRCNQVFAIAGSRRTAESRALRALETGGNLRRALASGEVSNTPAA